MRKNRFLSQVLCVATAAVLSFAQPVQVMSSDAENVDDSQIEEVSEVQTNLGETEQESGFYQILLIGVDRRDDSWEGNSDVMMLLTINDERQQISMISLMRDTLVHIPGIGMNKLNAANANGGPELLLETVRENYDVDVDKYISVDFDSLIDIVDAVGGVELTLSDAEAQNANTGIGYLCGLKGISPEEYYFPGGGTYLCNGMQAVNYARIRYVGNADYERTERQRTVLTKIAEKLEEMDSAELLVFAVKMLPIVTHNISLDELTTLIARFPELKDYELIQDRIPYDGLFSATWVNGMDVLVPDWGPTLEKLQETIY